VPARPSAWASQEATAAPIPAHDAAEIVQEPLAAAPSISGIRFREPFYAQPWKVLVPAPDNSLGRLRIDGESVGSN
jgi:hypothetical protein